VADLDLRSTLRPMVDQPARAPLPVGDLAQRARRHQLRRRSAVAALALVAVVGIAGALAVQDSPSRVTTTNAPPPAATPDAPSPSEPTPSVTTSPAPALVPEAEPTTPPSPSTDEGIVTTVTTTSSWDRGHCVEVRVENTTATPVTWEVSYTPAGTVATLWNARTSTDGTTFTGEPWNATLAPTEWTTFGICIDT